MECSVVVVGDAKIGKTALIRSLTHNEFTEVGAILPYYVTKARNNKFLLCTS